jgi:hypothetical protein
LKQKIKNINLDKIMRNRLLTAIIGLIFTFSTGTSYALIPLIPGVFPLLTYFGATGAIATAIDYSLVLHAAVLAIALNRDTGGASSPTTSQLTVKLNPLDPLPTPAGWTAPPSGQIKPIPPSTVTPPVGGYKSPSLPTVFGTGGEACTAHAHIYGPTFYGTYDPKPPGQFDCTIFYEWGEQLARVDILDVAGDCPTGYTVNDGVCNLTSASSVIEPSNNNCQIIRVGNTYSTNPNDPDCATGQPTMNGATVTPNSVSMTRVDGSAATVTINSDGTVTASESYPDIPNSKTNTLTSNFASPSGSSGGVLLTGIGTNSAAGIGTGQNNNGKNGPTGDGQIVVDKLTSQDAAAAASAAGNGSLPVDPHSVSGVGLPTENLFSSVLPSSISNFLMPSSSGSCVSLEVSLPYMPSMVLSPCAVVDAVRPMVNWLIIALGVIGGVMVWIRPNGGTA